MDAPSGWDAIRARLDPRRPAGHPSCSKNFLPQLPGEASSGEGRCPCPLFGDGEVLSYLSASSRASFILQFGDPLWG